MNPARADVMIPKLTDIKWKLEIVSNAPGAGSDNVLYTVTLVTDAGNDVNFTCGSQQLQDLVYNLKDILRQCDGVKDNLV